MKKNKNLNKQINHWVAIMKRQGENSVDLLLSTVAYAHNEKDVEPLNEFVFGLVSIEEFTYSLHKIVKFLEKHFQVYWSHTKDEFLVRPFANHLSESKLHAFTVDSVLDEICGEDIPYSEISFRRQKKIDSEKFMKEFLATEDSDKHGPFGVPQDPRYNKYRIKIKRK